ncbi:hypothetical protein [Nocardioides sp. AX2bis]|uniref:hypothetical protein n=1 Tax=Nocardioides sp. AX2bis TaxID=2653157 RepID=UPI0012F472FB|nr:hypothetical protein [Nocardioides sp. AX2bis]VXC57403.1 conserved membrane hypothetical protein [Nocardioides sp. AX2bis]
MSARTNPGDRGKSRKQAERWEDPDAGDDVTYVGPSHVVNPRWSWGGLVLLVLGGVLAGVGVAVTLVWLIAVGAVVLAAGAFAALRGNLFYDIEGGSLSPNGEKTVSPGATARVDDEEMRTDVAEEEQELARIRAREGVRPTLRRPAAALLVLLGVWLLFTQGTFYVESDPSGRDGTFRALSAGLVLVLPGMYLLLKRSSVVAAAICLVAGVGLVLGGVLADTSDLRGPVNEVICGVLVLLAAPVAALPALTGRPRA